MNAQTLLNKPTAPKVEPKFTKISGITQISTEVKKSSTKLRKVFEKGTYQKRTQLSVLNRYKRRLEYLQTENDKKFTRKQKVKIKLPEIKKYVGNFFTPGSADDPFKAIGALAAFKAFQKGSKGDWGGALGSGLVAAGMFLGPSLLGAAVSGVAGRGSNLRPGFDASGRRVSSGAQKRYLSRYGDKAFKNRFGSAALKRTQQGSTPQTAKVGKAFGRFGKAIIPGVGAALGAIDATMRAQEGDVTGASIAGTSASLDALAAASAATGIGLPIAGLLSIASFGLDVVNLVRDLSGASEKEAQRNKANQPDRVKAQTEKQKASVNQNKEKNRNLTFGKTLNSYSVAVMKFEQFVRGFVGGMGGEQVGVIETGNRAIATGQELQEMDATGGESPGSPDSPYGPRRGRMHQGNDYFRPSGTPISIIQPGTVTVADMNYDPSGWGAVVEIRHPDGSLSRYAHLSRINVAAGMQVTPGQVIGLTGGAAGAPGSGNSEGPHLHFEYETGAGRVNPTAIAPKIFRFGGNVSVRGASSARPILQPAPAAPAPSSNQPATPLAVRPPARSGISRQLPYQQGYSSPQPMIVPYPVIQQPQKPQMMQGSGGMGMMSGPTEEQVLNSFYKKVLLNSLL